MPSRRPAPGSGTGAVSVTRVAIAATAVVVVLAFVAACSPTPPPISDPRAILDAAVAHLRSAHTVHLDVTVDGSLALTGLGGGPASTGRGIGLTGTHLQGDLDFAGGRAAIRFQVPALLGLEGELRQLGSDSYLESSLTSPGWHRLTTTDLPPALDRPTGWLDVLSAWLERPATVPVRLDDAACHGGTCYVVRIVPGAADVEALASGAPDVADALGRVSLSVDLRVDQATLVLSEAVIRVDLGPGGSLAVSATFSHWDAGVSIAAPAASEVVTGPLFP